MASVDTRLAALREFLKARSGAGTVFIVEGGTEFHTTEDPFDYLRKHGAYTPDGRRIVLYPHPAEGLVQVFGGPQGSRIYDAGGVACTQTAGAGGAGGKTGLYMNKLLERVGNLSEKYSSKWIDWLPDFSLLVALKWIMLVLILGTAALAGWYGAAAIRGLFL